MPWAAFPKAGVQRCLETPYREIQVIWSGLEGEGGGGICWLPWSPEGITVNPLMYTKLEAWPSGSSFYFFFSSFFLFFLLIYTIMKVLHEKHWNIVVTTFAHIIKSTPYSIEWLSISVLRFRQQLVCMQIGSFQGNTGRGHVLSSLSLLPLEL